VLDNEFVYRIAYIVSREGQGTGKKIKGKREKAWRLIIDYLDCWFGILIIRI